VAFSVNTNIASLQAQNYLASSSNFQSKTINRVTSGLRIISSGDDAAGLAIANSFRSDQAVLTQGIRNGNDGLSTLQTIDGGMSNISQLLDRARTLATQSASGTFTGGVAGRAQLNSEFQSVLTEIDRQAQAIGLNVGGEFAKSLSVFLGGGRGTDDAAVITNGAVAVDLSKSTVDTGSLGLKGYAAGYTHAGTAADPDSGSYDLGASSATSVSEIIADNADADGVSHFTMGGPGFAGVDVAVNLSGINSTATLVDGINAAIAASESAGTAAAAALKAANIRASIHTGTDGAQQLVFTSSKSTFSVEAADVTANGFLGNFTTNANGDNTATTGVGRALDADSIMVAGGTQQITAAWAATLATATDQVQSLTISIVDSTGTPQSVDLLLDSTAADITQADAVTAINTALQASNDAALQGIVARSQGTDVVFSSASSQEFTVSFGSSYGTAGDTATGFDAFENTIQTSDSAGVGSTVDISTQEGAQAAVTALAKAVTSLGDAQAVVGKGQNNFNYAMNLAQSSSTNLAAAESRIRDADLASEAANLTKAQILLQAGVAALAQANSAPQVVLSLLNG